MKLRHLFTLATVAAVLALPSLSMAATTYTGNLKASDFKIKGPNKKLWKGKKGVLVRWKVTDHAGSFDYQFTVANKNGNPLKLEFKRVLVQKQPVVGATAPLATIGGLSKFETGFKKKATVSFSSDTAPGTTWLKLKGHGVRAFTRFSYNIVPLIDEEPDNTGGGNGNGNGNGNDVTVVPVPAAAWAGLALLGGLGGIKALRRKRNLA